MRSNARILIALIAIAALAGCSQRESSSTDAADARPDAAQTKRDALDLTAAEKDKAGIRSSPASVSDRRVELAGYGVVLAHDTIAQGVAELRQAEAIAAQSEAAIKRAQRLTGTPGAMAADQVEAALRQSAVDQSTALLARQKLSALIGAPQMDGRGRNTLLQDLSNGEKKLLRATFPAAAPGLPPAATLHAQRIGEGESAPIESLGPAWVAPADPGVPGRSYFAVFARNAFVEGERVRATASADQTLHGVFVPRAAVVLFDAQPWFYIEHAGGNYQRIPLDTDRYTEGGYVLSDPLKSGDRVVIEGAALLLAKEQGGADEPE